MSEARAEGVLVRSGAEAAPGSGTAHKPSLRVAVDYLNLTKPGIMLLLLLTEGLAMVTAAHGWPGWALLASALGGGACASGGAAAINCWLDRDIDAVMGRTRRRPLPAGRISPAPALAFGLVLTAAGMAIFFAVVNPVAGLLSLAGALMYVVVYTLWLKRSTTNNIVIGGVAGAIPPMVGWAAVTHSVGAVAGLLFLVIFLWTPPHFWALSLIVRRDYQAVTVPMRPVVVGLHRTKTAILGYALATVACSCALAFWLGAAELALALALGVPLLLLSWRVLKEVSGMRWARQLFRFSIAYLLAFFLGTALVAVLVR